MSKRILFFAGLAFLISACLAGCSSYRQPPVALDAGYYVLESRGVFRRLIVVPGSIRISYDTWRISTVPNDNAKHEHFDLVGDSETPQSGWFSVAQNGTDCGKAYLSPYVEHGKIVRGILILQYGGAWGPFGGGTRPDADGGYASQDGGAEFRTALAAAREPN